MLRLRRLIERGLANRWLRPLLLLVLCVVLAMALVQSVHDGDHAATEVGGLCFAIMTAAWLVIAPGARRLVAAPRGRVLSTRAPPEPGRPPFLRRDAAIVIAASPPLRL
jgi:uncharacterized membrane protein